MNYYRIGIFVFCFCTGGLRLLSAQEKPQEWTLKNCIDYALTQNIQLKKSKIALESSQVDSKSEPNCSRLFHSGQLNSI